MKIGLSLSGGVARGMAHIGLIKAFEEIGIEPNVLAGTSAGSIVAVFYAAGFSADEMFEIIKDTKLLNVLSPGFSIKGLGDLTFLKNLVRNNISHSNLQELPKQTFVCATNLSEGKVEYLNEGPIDLTLMASCSIPLLLKPTTLNEKIYVDGGMIDNMPIEPLKNTCEKIISVNVNPHNFSANPQNVFSIGQRCFDLTVWRNCWEQAEKSDLFIDLTEAANFNIYDFGKAQNLFDAGYHQTIKHAQALETVCAIES